MALFDNIKRAFGFTDNEEEINNSEYISKEPYINPFKKQSKVIGNEIEQESNLPELLIPEDALVELLSLINSSLPDFIKKCIDIEAEKKFLNDLIGSSITQYCEKAKESAVQNLKLSNERDRLQLQQQNEELKLSVESYEQKIREIKNNQMSSERQKKSLTERIADLESQSSKLEGEVEQLGLEKMSLLNKLKVSQVKTEDNESLKEENIHLLEELNQFRNQHKESAEVINQEKDNLINEINSLKNDLEEKNNKVLELTSELILNKSNNEEFGKLSVENNTLKEKIVELSILADDNSNLKEKLKLNSEELQNLQEELNEANSALEVVREVQDQLDKVEEMKKRKDSKIERLSEEINELVIENESLKKITISLKKEIEDSNKIKGTESANNGKVKSKPKKNDSIDVIDMTVLDDTPLMSEPYIDYGNVGTESTPNKISKDENAESINNESELEEIPTISLFDTYMDVESQSDEKRQASISAIASNEDGNWMNYTPPTKAISDEDKEETTIKKENSQEADSLQMTLF